MHKIFLRTLLYIIGVTLLASCTEEKVYKIGVAQDRGGTVLKRTLARESEPRDACCPAFIRTRCKG